MKKRIDLILVDKRIAESRSKAQAMIMAGQISVNGTLPRSEERDQQNAEIRAEFQTPRTQPQRRNEEFERLTNRLAELQAKLKNLNILVEI